MRFLTSDRLAGSGCLVRSATGKAQDEFWKHTLKQQRLEEARWNYYARWDDDDDWRRYGRVWS